MSIPLNETAPSTDEEWAEALRDYGKDRDDVNATPPLGPDTEMQKPNLFDPTFSFERSSGSSSSTYTAEPIDIRRQRSSSVEAEDTLSKLRIDRASPPTRQSTFCSTVSNSSDRTGRSLSIPTTQPGQSASCSPSPEGWGSPIRDPSCHTAAIGIAYTVPNPGRPASAGPDGDEENGGGSEAVRAKLRAKYEADGWLPGPEPSRVTRLRRKRAIRRLGLCCGSEETSERHAVIAKYAEMAKQMFQTSSGTVSVMLGDQEITWGTDPRKPPRRVPVLEGVCSHTVLNDTMSCTVVADLEVDWRFQNNPHLNHTGHKFFASAPLRYHRDPIWVDFGALCIADDKPRETFDGREQALLLNLANMLMYQLITLQSEITAKKSSTMYESCISFLRRSVTPDHAKTHAIAEQERKDRKEIREQERKARREERRKRAEMQLSGLTPGSQTPTRPRRASRVDSQNSDLAPSIAPEVPLAVKTGPRDSKAAKRDADLSEKALFTDAARTLRKLLKADAVAIVNVDEYQLFIRRAGGLEADPRRKIKGETKEAIIANFLLGKPWPEDIDPVLHYVPRSNQPGVNVLGADSGSGPCAFHFGTRGTERTLSDFLESWLKTKHFWWDREDADDELAGRIMNLMPDEAQTVLGTAFLTYEGKARFAMFASWNKPPAEFGESHARALPFAWILGGCTMAALAIKKVRSLEDSQTSYSALQAHELRTPLHQILAITQLLRSSMNDLADAPQATNNSSLTTTEQIRDLLPFLDAIDTSGKTLHGIVDNILSFLDLKGKDNMISASSPSLLNSPSGVTQSLEVMFEEIIHDASEEDKRSRRANGQPLCHTETVFEIIPPLLGEQVTEDAGGALRRAMSKILSNAFKFIEGEGCVEIYVDDVEDLLPPVGCEDLALTKKIKITIVDNGKGMDSTFVKEKLGEPWAKEDPYATGSGLSVHLAYRIIDLMGGQMEITSGPGQGCTVELEVAVPRRNVMTPSSTESRLAPGDPTQLALHHDDIDLKRKVALIGFDSPGPGLFGRQKLLEALDHQYTKLGCEIVGPEDANLAIIHGHLEEELAGVGVLQDTKAKDVVFLVGAEHDAHPDVLLLERQLDKEVRRFRKPATPSILRETLFPGQSKELLAEVPTRNGTKRTSINSPEQVTSHGRTASTSTAVGSDKGSSANTKPRPHFAEDMWVKTESKPLETPGGTVIKPPCPIVSRLAALWKPRNMDVEDAVACLSLGDYFGSRRRGSLNRVPSNASSNSPSTPTFASDTASSFDTPQIGSEGGDEREEREVGETPMSEEEEEEEEPVEEIVKVLVVEDNVVNRKILVRILSSKLPIEVHEAEDGHAAVEKFKQFTSPVIVLLDINMPKMDGYQACTEMRAIEKALGRDKPSQIIAVTALGGEADKHRGLVECGMNQWHTKPCSKVTIHKIVNEARELLIGARAAVEVIPEQVKAQVGLGLGGA